MLATAALAHSVLMEIEPKDGGVYGEAPAEARLRFNEAVTPVAVRLFASSGASEALPARVADKEIVAPLPAAMASGTYLLSYRVISRDGHPLGGSVAFSIGGAIAPLPVSIGAPRWEIAFPFVHGAALIALFLAIGGAALTAFAVPDKAWTTRAAARRLVPAAALVGVVAALASVGVRGAGLADSPLAEFATATPWRIGLSTPLGLSFGLTLTASLIAALTPLVRGTSARLMAVAALALLSWGLAVASHAALAAPEAISFPAYMLHVAVAAFWLGSLPLLAVALAREPVPVARAIVAAFSGVAVWGVAAMVLAGVALTAAQTGADVSVWEGPAWSDTAYGGVLAAKVLAAALLVGVAVRNNRLLTPRLASDETGPARLRRAIGIELGAMTVIIALAATLAVTEPPRSTAALAASHRHPPAGAESGIVVDATRDGVEILLEVDPATSGPNELIVHFFDGATGNHLAPTTVTVLLSMTTAGIEPLRRIAVAQADGTYRVADVPLPVAGTWQARIEAQLTQTRKLTVTMDIPLGEPESPTP